MPLPTSAPQPSAPGKERRLKLRASCDSCALSKVKCSKEHPSCARCSANGWPCIYGVSRKHGKPGRTRKRNLDEAPFIKATRQRLSPEGGEFGKFRIQPESVPQGIQQPFSDVDFGSHWASDWSPTPTPSLPTTPDLNFEMKSEPFYTNMGSSGLALMDDTPMPTAQFESGPTHTNEHAFIFRDPFAKKQSVQLDFPDLQALKDYVGGDIVNPMDCSFNQTTTAMVPSQFFSSPSAPQSPKSRPTNSYSAMPVRVSISTPTTHCCYTVAYATLESLKVIGAKSTHIHPTLDEKSFDCILSVTKLAIESVLQLLRCPCSSDPHLAMLYSSITSKIITWYQIAAGVTITAASHASISSPSPSPALECSPYASPPSTSGFLSPLTTPVFDEEPNFEARIRPLSFAMYGFDEREQRRRRGPRVLFELHECGQLVEVLANWKGDGWACEQAEFLYDILGAWLKSELYKTVNEVKAMDAFSASVPAASR
ncbi:hypothetical protein BDW02DRAFT_567760 [Decorospora gaudefroyi]|uniref:Zn(2)-C6 fungal-type domain-containing protein n=1 Tax=Decorospora gaudefroyi TaxID=184978 RepID=A0A6A5KMX6_9PLEO|nr:hypothetical protein BDW02DRAFT_567760 [Decorospora gaudefroyi]